MSLSSRDPNPESTELVSATTVATYREMVRLKDRTSIADLIQKRFEERYLNPVLDSSAPHGFAMLAICCLMVEALESFRKGWASTESRRGGEPFCAFFQAHAEFSDLRPVAHDFYHAVRCGILHQGETTHGWRVNRNPGQLLEISGDVHWVSAWEFGQRLSSVLAAYCNELKDSDWDAPIWKKARRKLQKICENCGVGDAAGLA